MSTSPNVIWRANPGSQALFLACPVFEVLYHGTRGPGKTDALLMDFAQHVGRGFGQNWRGILFRRTYKQLDDVVAKSKRWFRQIWPAAKFNESDYTWKFPTGEELLLRYMGRPDDYWNYHGHEYPWIGWEELTNWPTSDCYEMMKACSRSSFPGMPRKYRSTANPYGVGHSWVKLYFIDAAPAGAIVRNEEGVERTHVAGHWSENRPLMEADAGYAARLASDTNENRRKAWLDGRWDIVAGGMFDDVWSAAVHVVKPFSIPAGWRIDRSFDWGSSRPFSVGWWAESDGTQAPDGRVYPRGTLFRIGEWYGWDGKNPNTGLRMTDVMIARGIVERETAMGIRDRVKPGPADSSIFHAEPGRKSIADAMREHGVSFTEADKRPGSRKAGWQRVRGMLEAALESPMEWPGLFVFDHCRQFIRTLPVLPRSDRDPDDVDTEAEDHIADEVRYRCTAPKQTAEIIPFRV